MRTIIICKLEAHCIFFCFDSIFSTFDGTTNRNIFYFSAYKETKSKHSPTQLDNTGQ